MDTARQLRASARGLEKRADKLTAAAAKKSALLLDEAAARRRAADEIERAGKTGTGPRGRMR